MKTILLPLLVLLSGCATLGPAFTETQPAPKTRAQVYVYRVPRFTGSAFNARVLWNDEKIATLPSGSYARSEVPAGPGKMALKNALGETVAEMPVDVKAGQSYFLRLDFSLPALRERFRADGTSTGEKCPYMMNIGIAPSKEEVVAALREMDGRVQKATCLTGVLFVNETFAKSELPQTKLSQEK